MKDKWIVLQDLCARLYTNTIVNYNDIEGCDYPLNIKTLSCFPEEKLKCYLRPMSSITVEEEFELNSKEIFEPAYDKNDEADYNSDEIVSYVDYCYRHHLDIHRLIPENLALEAPEGMYDIK